MWAKGECRPPPQDLRLIKKRRARSGSNAVANAVGSALAKRAVNFWKAEAGGGGGVWWGRLRWMYWDADLIYVWREGGKFIYTDCRLEVASARHSRMSEKATLREKERKRKRVCRCGVLSVCVWGSIFASQVYVAGGG